MVPGACHLGTGGWWSVRMSSGWSAGVPGRARGRGGGRRAATSEPWRIAASLEKTARRPLVGEPSMQYVRRPTRWGLMDDHDTTVGMASALNGTGHTPGDPAPEPGPVNHTTAFLAEIARAMHAAAGEERQRIAAQLAEEATAQVERTQARAAIEIEELRRLADEDIERIHAWSASEMERITAEEARRTEQRRADLESYLEEHET